MIISQREYALPQAEMHDYKLGPSEELYLQIDNGPVVAPAEGYKKYRIDDPIIAEVTLSEQRFAIADTRESSRFGSDLLIASELHRTSGGKLGYKGLWQDEPIVLGRVELTDRFEYSNYVSARHVEIAYDGLGLMIQNLRPTNATYVSGNILSRRTKYEPEDNLRCDYTYDAEADKREDYAYGFPDEIAPYGYYRNHSIIGRKSTTVRDGVYFTTRPMSEAVVVDDKSRIIRDITTRFIVNLKQKYGPQPTVYDASILQEVNRYTGSIMPYRLEAAEEISEPYNYNNGLVGLSTYIQNKAGVCRHQCLLAAHLIEALVDEGFIAGTVSVERNHDIEANGAHAWTVFKGIRGTEIIVDPAQAYVGTREQAQKEGRWKYRLPVER